MSFLENRLKINQIVSSSLDQADDRRWPENMLLEKKGVARLKLAMPFALTAVGKLIT